jgi:multiple sugar transport system permease protein
METSGYLTGTGTSTKLAGFRVKWSKIGHYLLLIILALIILGPLYLMVLTSLKQQVVIMSREPVWFFIPTVNNYRQIVLEENFLRHLLSSFTVGLVSTILTLFVSGWAAYAIARMRFSGRGLMANTTLVVRMVPPAVLTVPIVALWGAWETGLIFGGEDSYFFAGLNNSYLNWINSSALCTSNSYWLEAICPLFKDGLGDGRLGLILFYSALNLPFTVWLLIGFIRQIPVELEEAAIVDGATPYQVFSKVLFPLMKSGYAVAAIFVFRIAWNEFLLALILTGRTSYTLPVKTTLFIRESGVQWGLIMAMGTLILIPPLLLTFFAARQIIAGMTAGAVKG